MFRLMIYIIRFGKRKKWCVEVSLNWLVCAVLQNELCFLVYSVSRLSCNFICWAHFLRLVKKVNESDGAWSFSNRVTPKSRLLLVKGKSRITTPFCLVLSLEHPANIHSHCIYFSKHRFHNDHEYTRKSLLEQETALGLVIHSLKQLRTLTEDLRPSSLHNSSTSFYISRFGYM